MSMDSTPTCEHYKRHCDLLAVCCNAYVSCRVCHNDEKDHEMDRTKVVEIRCRSCSTTQTVAERCESCDTQFGVYSCLKCRLFDDDTTKGQFHCDGCGVCRVGGKDNFFHCGKCRACIGVVTRDTHVCIEGLLERNCPICLENMADTRLDLHLLPCGHALHRKCFIQYSEHSFACPMCNKTMHHDMKAVWDRIDDEVAQTPMPSDLPDRTVSILCNDCQHKTTLLYHIVGHKCAACGSYNTAQIGESSTLADS